MILFYIVVAIIVVATYTTYVGLIKKKNKVMEAFSSIDVQLKKRYDLIPNIVTVAKAYMEHEKSLLLEITDLRRKAKSLSGNYAHFGKRINVDEQLETKLDRLIALVENYPDLKSDKTMLQLMYTYSDVEEHIAAARRFYNSATLELKVAVETFPSSVLAGLLGIKSTDFFKISDEERRVVHYK